MLHCWKDKTEWAEEKFGWGSPEHMETDATCFLEDGHSGEHEWTPDSEITIRFTGEEK